MKISIITPSFNMLPYLKNAAASAADQDCGEVEHLVIDGGSVDGSLDWLQSGPYPHLKFISEKDEGMYDAVNKGLKMAQGDILAYLNCDEQYLPRTLNFIAGYFRENPRVDVVFGDALLIRPDGSLIAYRKGYVPRWFYIASSHLYVLSCTMFFRRRVIDDGFFFDTRYRAAGDAEFVVRLLRAGYCARHLKRYMAAFTMTGKNLSVDDKAIRERKLLLANAPFLVRKSKWLLNAVRLSEKLFSGAYFQKMPLEYSVYTGQGESVRRDFRVDRASFFWKFE